MHPSPRRIAIALPSLLALALGTAGCPAGPDVPAVAFPAPVPGPDGELTLGPDNRDALEFGLLAAPLGSTERSTLREALIAGLSAEARAPSEAAGPVSVSVVLERVLRTFEPEELVPGLSSRALGKLVEWLEPEARRRGTPEDSLAVAHLRLLLEPGSAEPQRTVTEIREWIRSSGEDNPAVELERLVRAYEQVTRVLPAPSLVKETLAWVLQRSEMGEEAVPLPPRERTTLEDVAAAMVRDQLYFSGLTITVLRLASRMGRPELAVTEMEARLGDPGFVREVLDQVGALENPAERADALAELAEAMAGGGSTESRVLCQVGRREFPADGRFSACLGAYYAAQEEWGTATRFLAEAAERSPDEREFADQTLALLATEISYGTDRVSWGRLQGLYEAFRAAHARHRALFPLSEPPVAEAPVMGQMADAALVEGEVETARELHAAALALEPSAAGYLAWGRMEGRAGNRERAVELLRAGLEAVRGDLGERLRAQAEIQEELGRLAEEAGSDPEPDYDRALRAWRDLGRNGVVTRARADLRIGILDVRSGARDRGLRRVGAALRDAAEDPFPASEDVTTFNQGLSFLHLAGEADRLVEWLPLAAARGDIDPVWRVYYCLWTLGALRAAGRPDDADAVAFLRAVPAEGWSRVLARFALGEIDYAQALAAADTPGHRAELSYYEGLNRLGAGDAAGARALFEQAVASRIYNYFEWEMAREALRRLDGAEGSASAPLPSAGLAQ